MSRYILRATLFAGLLFTAADQPLHAQTNGEKGPIADSNPNENPDTKWQIINTVLFALGLGWALAIGLLGGVLPAFHAARLAVADGLRAS